MKTDEEEVFEEKDNSLILKECETKLIENDSILDSQLYEILQTFISSGGSPKVIQNKKKKN